MKAKSNYSQYLTDLQAKLNTSDDVISKVIKEAAGQTIINKKRIVAGEANEVYDMILSSGIHVILRISRKETPDFLQEKWAIEKCQQINLPVPEILLVKHLKIENELLSFCVQKKLPGDTLERGNINFRKMGKVYVRKMMQQAGYLLSLINSISTSGFGELDGEGKGEFKSYYDLMAEKTGQETKYLNLAQRVQLDGQIMTKALSILQSYLKNLPKIEPKLAHGDYGFKHLMVEGEKITGILDWGEVSGNSQIFDIARWDYWFGDELPIDYLIEGYSEKSLFGKDFQDHLHLIRIDRGLDVLHWYEKQKYNEAIEKAKAKLLKDIKYFQ